jgi:hypothetical protein
MSGNGENLRVIHTALAERWSFGKLCRHLVGERVLFPSRIHGVNHDAIKRLGKSGYTARQIAEHLRMPRSTVYYVLGKQ